MNLEVLTDPAELPRIRQAWEELCDATGGSVTAFASYQWHESWWRHYSAGAPLRLLCLWDSGRLVGVAPFMLREVTVHGLPARALCFIANSQSLNNDFIVRPESRELFLREVFGYLSRQGSEWEMMLLKNVPATSDNYRTLVEFLDQQGTTWRQRHTSIESPYLVPEGGWEEYLAGRTLRTRKALRNIQNTIHKAGEVAVRLVTTPADFLAVKDEAFEVARQSWSENGGDSLGSAGNEAFYTELGLEAAHRGWLRLWTLSLNGKMIAIEFHLRAYGKEHAMRGHYLPEFAALSPGTYLELQILRNAFEEPERVRTYDFCGSFEAYKRKWTDLFVPHCDIEIFGKTPRARMIALNETRVVPLLRSALPQGFWNHKLFRICGISTKKVELK